LDVTKRLAESARHRAEDLKKRKEEGVKIVGYTGRFVPEELILAAGAAPYFIGRGGEPDPAEEVLPYMLRILNPFARAQIGYHLLGMEPMYPMLDLIVAECSDCHYVRLADLFEYFKLPTARLGVPPDWEKAISFDYYHKQLIRLAERLEALTGNKITDESLTQAINSLNGVRSTLWKISELRKQQSPPIGGYDFMLLNHHSFYADIDVQTQELQRVYEELKQRESPFSKDAPRLLLAGRMVAVGDYVLPKLIETLGAVVVAEFLDEGHRLSEWQVKPEGDLIKSIADTYYMQRTPPTVFQPAWQERVERLESLVRENDIDGVVWYQLSFEEIYDMECSLVSRAMEKMKMPFLKLESSFEYSREAMGPLTTRVESFIESIRLRK
jgi:benzoyl-CoA reductase/2-hydroxyglutaryl-CoA dehydratase subunit BcrC/BadD/HgdB